VLNKSIKNAFFKLIYQEKVNKLARNVSYPIARYLPEKFQLPPNGVIKLDVNNTKIYLATNQTSYLTKILYWKGLEAFEYTTIFLKLIKKANVFLDIGSNIGYYSLLATASNKKIKTYAFEPAFGPKHFLKENIRLNGFENTITLCDQALSNIEGVLDFYEVKNDKYPWITNNLSGEHNAGTKTKGRNYKKTTVNTTTIDAFIAKNSISKIDLIKIDTEGTEVDILKKGLIMIQENEPIIICETLFNTTENELESFFKNLNYSFFNVIDDKLVKVDSIIRVEDNGVRNCFFVPTSKLSWVTPFI